MISLRALLLGEDIKAGVGDSAEAGRDRDIWRVDSEDSSVVRYGARNSFGKVRYFKKEEDARKFASGEIKGPHPGRAEPKQTPERVEKKQTYKSKND